MAAGWNVRVRLHQLQTVTSVPIRLCALQAERGGSAGTFRAMGRAAPGRCLMLAAPTMGRERAATARLIGGHIELIEADVMELARLAANSNAGG